MRVLYTIGIWFYTMGVRVAALFGHEKARLRVENGEWRVVNSQLSTLNSPLSTQNSELAWFHASSLGEFEQARPVLEEYRRRHPGCRVVLTFFSPSGYEVRKNYAQADVVLYLPPDLPGSVRRFLDACRPTVAFFVKYDFWFNYLGELRRRNIPTYIFSAIFRPGQYFFKPWGRWYLRQLGRCFTHIFVQNDESLQLLRSHGIGHSSLAGDTRFDRVHQIALAAEGNDVVERWLSSECGTRSAELADAYENSELRSPNFMELEGRKVLVCGSTWPPDEEMIAELRMKSEELRIILAPHVINEEHLRQIEGLFPDSIRYSELCGQWSVASGQFAHQRGARQADASTTACAQLATDHWPLTTKTVLIIDNIGMLSKLYRYADVAYIGGGFGSGIHNILEAVTFGKPVLFGPNYKKFQEAHDIISRGGGFSHSDADSLRRNLVPLLTDPDAYSRASQACTEYMQENLGSTEKILKMIEEK